ncbi:hypothetical protein [Photobacterium damselae]|uniref:hypothetical protein n=1 Tax=Photobacterium damselae TaxID=38293 RepID=UPI00370AEDF5
MENYYSNTINEIEAIFTDWLDSMIYLYDAETVSYSMKYPYTKKDNDHLKVSLRDFLESDRVEYYSQSDLDMWLGTKAKTKTHANIYM